MPQTDFLEEFVIKILDESGLDLNDEQKKIYIPQIQSLLEERIGLVLMPKLSEEDREQFFKLVEDDVSAEDWTNFWTASIPNFEEELKNILTKFAEEVKQSLAS